MDYVEPEGEFRLNPNQMEFVKKWIQTGNASFAYKEAYEVESDRVAESNGSRLLRNAEVRRYIDAVLGEAQNELIADAREIMERLTRNARRLEMSHTVAYEKSKRVWYETGSDGKQKRMEEVVEKPVVVETPGSITDSNRALELLGKANRLFTDRVDMEIITPQFIEDVPDDD